MDPMERIPPRLPPASKRAGRRSKLPSLGQITLIQGAEQLTIMRFHRHDFTYVYGTPSPILTFSPLQQRGFLRLVVWLLIHLLTASFKRDPTNGSFSAHPWVVSPLASRLRLGSQPRLYKSAGSHGGLPQGASGNRSMGAATEWNLRGSLMVKGHVFPGDKTGVFISQNPCCLSKAR